MNTTLAFGIGLGIGFVVAALLIIPFIQTICK